MRGLLIASLVVGTGAGALLAAGWLADSPANPGARQPPAVGTELAAARPATPAASLPPGPTAPVPPVQQQALTEQPRAAPPAPAATPPEVPAAAAPPATPVPPPAPQAALVPPPAPPGAPLPTFDVVRVNPNGRAVIAGRAAPEAEVTVQLGNDAVATTKADRFGEWVAIPNNPLPQGPHELTLQAVSPAGVRTRSEQVVTLVVPYTNAPVPERPLAIVQDREGVNAPRVLQAPPVDGAASPPGVMTLDAVQYDQGGNVVLAGRARLGTDVRAYVDDRPVGVVAADPGGQWQLTPNDTLTVGRHQLRLEQVDGGILMSKMELPFMRAPPEAIRALAPGEVIVQPGNSLWRIARNTYGRGTLFTVIYLANAEQIQNPDLIYPGQVFMLPGQQ